jgi:hypothetical protein
MPTADKFRFLIGGLAVLGVILMSFAFALGRVEEHTSFGLIPVLSFLGMIVGDFAKWMYHTERKDPDRRTDSDSQDPKPKP